ncbi:MAG: hypothetical protein ACOCUV_01855 [bacterium]
MVTETGKNKPLLTVTESKTENPLINHGLNEILREGTRKMLQAAIEAEVPEFIENYSKAVDHNGQRIITRNGICWNVKFKRVLFHCL